MLNWIFVIMFENTSINYPFVGYRYIMIEMYALILKV